MNERQVFEYLDSLRTKGIVPGLESIRNLLEGLGNPQKKLKFVHVAGTNGKGSVCSFLAGALKCGGYRVGRYLSPTIFEYRERIQVNDRMITKEALARLLERIKAVCEEMVDRGLPHPTAFEVETALGFLYFCEKNCDIVVLETGMGGALDATNIVENTVLCVFASISRDHMQFLGNTLEEIAAQKAGILKPGAVAVSAEQLGSVRLVLQERADHLQLPITFVDPDAITDRKYGLEKQRFSYHNYTKVEISLAGKYQLENAALALEALRALAEKGFPVSEEKLRKGFRETVWPGRFTVVRKKPLFIADGAHNEDAARRLAESIEFYFTNKRIIYIMGVLRDKEYEKIIDLTARYAESVITVTTPNNPRALPAYELACAVSRVCPNVTAVDSLEEAVEMSSLLAGKDDCVIAFGSLSFLGQLMDLLQYRRRKPQTKNRK